MLPDEVLYAAVGGLLLIFIFNMLPAKKRFPPPPKPWAAFDKNGVLYYLGTKGGTCAYQNPHTAGEVVAKMSSSGNGTPDRFVQHSATGGSTSRCNTGDKSNSWMSVDLGAGRSLVPNHYCLRHDSHDGHVLRHWKLEGSNDGSTWTILRNHKNDSTIPTQPLFLSLAFGSHLVPPLSTSTFTSSMSINLLHC